MDYAKKAGTYGMDYMQRASNNMSDTDKELWDLMQDVPKLQLMIAGVCAVLNLGLGGVGTIVCGCMQKDAWDKTQIWIGVLQFFLAPYLVGYIWAQYWSFLIVMKAIKSDEQANTMFNTVTDPKFSQNVKDMQNFAN